MPNGLGQPMNETTFAHVSYLTPCARSQVFLRNLLPLAIPTRHAGPAPRSYSLKIFWIALLPLLFFVFSAAVSSKVAMERQMVVRVASGAPLEACVSHTQPTPSASCASKLVEPAGHVAVRAFASQHKQTSNMDKHKSLSVPRIMIVFESRRVLG